MTRCSTGIPACAVKNLHKKLQNLNIRESFKSLDKI